MKRLTTTAALFLLIISSSSEAHSPAKSQTIEQFAESLSEAYVAKKLGRFAAALPRSRKLRLVIEHSLVDDDDKGRFVIKEFKTLAQCDRWLTSQESPDGFPFRVNRPLRQCKQGVCTYDMQSGLAHKQLYLDRFTYGYRNGRLYIKTIYLLDGD